MELTVPDYFENCSQQSQHVAQLCQVKGKDLTRIKLPGLTLTGALATGWWLWEVWQCWSWYLISPCPQQRLSLSTQLRMGRRRWACRTTRRSSRGRGVTTGQGRGVWWRGVTASATTASVRRDNFTARRKVSASTKVLVRSEHFSPRDLTGCWSR